MDGNGAAHWKERQKMGRRYLIKPGRFLLAAAFFLLTTAMYYFNTEYIRVGGIDIMYKMFFAALILAGSFVVFLVDTNLEKAGALAKYTCVLLLPHIIVLFVSMPLWVINMSRMTVIRRGVFEQLYGISIVLASAGLIYIFEKSGLWLNLTAMLAANLITILKVIRQAGFHEYWQELKLVVLTFAKETGELMQAVEIHELTFALGLFLLFLLVSWREEGKKKLFWIFFVLTAFCFLSGMKRIGVFALALCVLSEWFLMLFTGKAGKRRIWLWLFSLAAVMMAFAYICVVRSGVYAYLEEKFQLDTMGRRFLNDMINQYYEISPAYLGQGGGFISRLFSDMPEDFTIRALHNDVLKVYIDIGFWGFWLWMLSFFPLRVYFVTKWQGSKGGIMCAGYCLFILVTAFTDNTIYYTYLTGAAAVLTMGCHF